MKTGFLPNEQWIVAPKSIHTSLMDQFLELTSAISGLQFLTFDSFLSTIYPFTNDKYKLFTSAYLIIQDKRSDCTVLNNSMHYPDFVYQCIDFAQTIHHYEISVQSLPTTNAKERDLKTCIQAISPLYANIPTFNKIKQLNKTYQHVTLYPFYTKLHQQELIQYLQEKGAQNIQPTNTNPEKIEYFVAMNKRQEIEAVAQWICLNPNKTLTIVLCDPSSYSTTLKIVFNRYNIPIQNSNSASDSLVKTQFNALYLFLKTLNSDNLINLLKANVFPHIYLRSFIDYIQHFDLTLSDLYQPLSFFQEVKDRLKYLNSIDKNRLELLEKEADMCRESIVNQLIPYISLPPAIATFNYFSTIFSNLNYSEQQWLLSIKEMIEQIFSTTDDVVSQNTCFTYFLDKSTLEEKVETQGVFVTDKQNLQFPPCDTVIVLGCLQKDFPGFVSESGLFDESYWEKTLLPSKNARLNHHLEQVKKIFSCHKHLIFSYPNGNYEGKSQTVAYEIDDFAKSKTSCKSWPLIQKGKDKQLSYTLSEESAQALFFKQKTLFGSVSSYEVFFRCPYQYFLKRGLKVDSFDLFELNNAYIGTMQHAILEECVKIDPKKYPLFDHNQLLDIISNVLQDLYILYPRKKLSWDMIKQRLLENISVTFSRLQRMESETSFVCTEQEKPFKHLWHTSLYPLSFKGIIDRIDQHNSTFRIIDYKSSVKNLKDKEFEGGLQLQLCTYSVVIQQQLDKTLSGAYYLSMLNKDVFIPANSVIRNTITPILSDDYHEIIDKKHRLTGWTFDDDLSGYHSANHVSNFTSKMKVRAGAYQLDLVSQQLDRLYDYLVHQLALGYIKRRPTSGSCQYCDYKDICIYKGREFAPINHLNNPDVTLQGKARDKEDIL